MSTSGDAAGLAPNAGRRDVLPTIVGTGVIVASIIGLALSDRGIELASGFPTWLALVGFVGLVAMAVAAWVVRSERPVVAGGISVVIVGLAVPSWTAWSWMPVGLLPILIAAGPMAVPGAAQIGLGWSPRIGQQGTLPAAYLLAGLASVVLAIGYDPLADPGCVFTCARSDPVGGSIVTTRGAVTTTAVLLGLGAVVTGWALLGRRRLPSLLRWGTGASLALLVAMWGLRALQWTVPVPGIAWIAIQAMIALLLAISVIAAWMVVRRQRAAAERLVAELNDPAIQVSANHVRAVEFAIPGEDRWVDADGRSARPPAMRGNAVVLPVRGELAVRLWLDHGASQLALGDMSPSTRVALANAALAAVTRARLADVRDSQRRIIQTSDAERRRIERDLHDVAQQRLISASLRVSLAESHLSPQSVDRARSAITTGLEHLRRLAHGLVPGVLQTEGLHPALEELVRESDVPASLEVDEVAMSEDVALAVHVAVAAAFAHAHDVRARSGHVEVRRLGLDRLELQIELDGLAGLDRWDEVQVADRIGAVGGSMSLDARPSRLVLRAELPCGS